MPSETWGDVRPVYERHMHQVTSAVWSISGKPLLAMLHLSWELRVLWLLCHVSVC